MARMLGRSDATHGHQCDCGSPHVAGDFHENKSGRARETRSWRAEAEAELDEERAEYQARDMQAELREIVRMALDSAPFDVEDRESFDQWLGDRQGSELLPPRMDYPHAGHWTDGGCECGEGPTN